MEGYSGSGGKVCSCPLECDGGTVTQIFADAVEHSIDELHRLRRRKLACNLERLVNHYCFGGQWIAKKFSNVLAQDIAVDGGHLFHPTMLSVLFDQTIYINPAVSGH